MRDMDAAVFAMLLADLRRQQRKPTPWPPTPTLLTAPQGYPFAPRDQWREAEWKSYAQYLEASGHELVGDASAVADDLIKALRKLTRRKPGMTTTKPQTRKRGRPSKKAQTENQVREILAIRDELAASGKKATDVEAVKSWFRKQGMRQSRVLENRAILNAVSAYRKAHKNSSR